MRVTHWNEYTYKKNVRFKHICIIKCENMVSLNKSPPQYLRKHAEAYSSHNRGMKTSIVHTD